MSPETSLRVEHAESSNSNRSALRFRESNLRSLSRERSNLSPDMF